MGSLPQETAIQNSLGTKVRRTQGTAWGDSLGTRARELKIHIGSPRWGTAQGTARAPDLENRKIHGLAALEDSVGDGSCTGPGIELNAGSPPQGTAQERARALDPRN